MTWATSTTSPSGTVSRAPCPKATPAASNLANGPTRILRSEVITTTMSPSTGSRRCVANASEPALSQGAQESSATWKANTAG